MATKTGKTKSKFSYGDDRRIASGFDRVMIYEFTTLEAHRSQVDASFRRTIKAAEKQYEKARPELDEFEPHQAEYLEFLAEQYQEAAELLPRLQWNAQFLVAFATFELCLSKLCRIVENKLGSPISYKDLQGVGIEQCRAYLLKVGKLKKVFDSKEGKDAWDMKGLRNVLAHANGEVRYMPNEKGHITEKIKRWKGIGVHEKKEGIDTYLVLKPEFVEFAIETFRKVTVEICSSHLPTK